MRVEETVIARIAETGGCAVRLGMAALLVFLSWLVGSSVGRQNSPHYRYEGEGSAYFIVNARMFRPTATSARVRLNAGSDVYTYFYPEDRLVRRPATNVELSETRNRWLIYELYRLNRLSGDSPMSAVADVKERINALRSLAGANSRGEVGLLVITAVLGATFGVVGYFSTYEDTRNYRNPDFVRGLSRITLWRHIARRSVDCSEMRSKLRNLQQTRQIRVWTPGIRHELDELFESSRPEVITALRGEAKKCEDWSAFFNETGPGSAMRR